MGTSRSSERRAKHTGGASIFSGRPDPSWTVDEKTVKRLKALWNLMEPHGGAPPQAPALGYRGCFLIDSSRNKWFAYKGVATLTTTLSRSESRQDEDRRFEALLLASAPKGAIPREMIDFKR